MVSVISRQPPSICTYNSQSLRKLTQSLCRPVNFGGTAFFAISMFAGLPEKANPNWAFTGPATTGATMVAVGANGLGKKVVSGPLELTTHIGRVIAAAVVGATLGATVLVSTNILIGSSKAFNENPLTRTGTPPCTIELDVA